MDNLERENIEETEDDNHKSWSYQMKGGIWAKIDQETVKSIFNAKQDETINELIQLDYDLEFLNMQWTEKALEMQLLSEQLEEANLEGDKIGDKIDSYNKSLDAMEIQLKTNLDIIDFSVKRQINKNNHSIVLNTQVFNHILHLNIEKTNMVEDLLKKYEQTRVSNEGKLSILNHIQQVTVPDNIKLMKETDEITRKKISRIDEARILPEHELNEVLKENENRLNEFVMWEDNFHKIQSDGYDIKTSYYDKMFKNLKDIENLRQERYEKININMKIKEGYLTLQESNLAHDNKMRMTNEIHEQEKISLTSLQKEINSRQIVLEKNTSNILNIEQTMADSYNKNHEQSNELNKNMVHLENQSSIIHDTILEKISEFDELSAIDALHMSVRQLKGNKISILAEIDNLNKYNEKNKETILELQSKATHVAIEQCSYTELITQLKVEHKTINKEIIGLIDERSDWDYEILQCQTLLNSISDAKKTILSKKCENAEHAEVIALKMTERDKKFANKKNLETKIKEKQTELENVQPPLKIPRPTNVVDSSSENMNWRNIPKPSNNETVASSSTDISVQCQAGDVSASSVNKSASGILKPFGLKSPAKRVRFQQAQTQSDSDDARLIKDAIFPPRKDDVQNN